MVASTEMHNPALHESAWRTSALRMLRYGLGILPVSVLTVSLLGCGGDATSPSTTTEHLWTLRFNQHAVQLALTAPHNTIQLTATPLTASGHVPVGLGPVQYAAKDSAVTVNATTGLVTAHSVTFQNAMVVATVTDTVHHATLQDTCYLQVTATAPSAPLSGFTLQSASGDTVALGTGGGTTMSTTATDAQGNPAAVMSYFQSVDASIAAVDKLTGLVTGGRLGQVMIYAETWAYGVAKRDSLLLTVGVPVTATINVLAMVPTGSTRAVLTFWPQITRVSAGALVTWANPSFSPDDSIDVVFDDPANVDSAQYQNFQFHFATGRGNIAPWWRDTLGTTPDSVSARICHGIQAFQQATSGFQNPCPQNLISPAAVYQRRRSFPVAGTYHYHSAIWGTSGTLIVQ